jgi:putative membrane protein
MWIWGPLMMIAVVLLIVWLIRVTMSSGAPQARDQRDPTARAREILAERYASGEISTDEYQERLDQLR